MPFIEPESGDVEHGVGGGNASINNQAFSSGGAGGWIDRDRAAFANGADGWIVSSYDKITGTIRRVDFGAGVVTPANTAYAGGGHVAAWLGSKGADRGLYSTIGLRAPDAGLLGVGPDGALAYKPAYQSNGPTIVREVDGQEWTLTPGHAGALQLLGGRRAIWMEGFAVRVANLPTPEYHADGGIWKAQAAFVGGQWWICYYSGSKGIVLHPFASSARVFSILPTGDGWHAIAPMGPNLLRIVIAAHEGEQQGDLWGYDLDVLTGAATPLPFWPGGAPRVFPFVELETINPPALPRPTFRFVHPVSVYPFKAEGSGRPDVFTLGTYSEAATPPAPLPKARLVLAHDSPADWTIPAGDLRSFDLVLWELYRVAGEPLEASAARWDRQARSNLAQWPCDCGVIPMFYNQFNPATGAWLWTDREVLEALEYLDQIVNLDRRIKVIAPFSFDRANGIKPNPNLRRSFDDLVAAAALAGGATLTPVPTPPIDPPIDPPHPPTPFRKHTKGSAMEIDGKIVQLRGAGGRLVAPDAPNTGTWGGLNKGWRGVRYVGDGDGAARMRARKLSSGRYTFTSEGTNGLAGADGGQYSPALDKQGYFKPDGDTDAGELEQWRVYDGNENGAIEAQIEQTTDQNHPAGAGRKFFVFPLTVEIVS